MRWFLLTLLAWTARAEALPPPGDQMRAAMEKQRAGVAAQKEAVRKQAVLAGVRLAPWSGDPQSIAEAPSFSPAASSAVPAQCDPIADDIVAPIIDSAAKARSLQPKLLRAVIEQESGFHPCAVSPKGAKGLMQLMPLTAGQLGVRDPFDAKENIEAGAQYLKQLLDKYKGNLPQALGAYNSGPATVDQAGGVPEIQETQDYVSAILRALAR